MRNTFTLKLMLLVALAVAPLLVGTAIGQDAAPEPAPAAAEVGPESADSSDESIASDGYATFAVNNLWICIAAALVFIMHLGFATLEAGLTQSKNTVNILFKNVWIISTGILL